jgi:hypothetical protein
LSRAAANLSESHGEEVRIMVSSLRKLCVLCVSAVRSRIPFTPSEPGESFQVQPTAPDNTTMIPLSPSG